MVNPRGRQSFLKKTQVAVETQDGQPVAAANRIKTLLKISTATPDKTTWRATCLHKTRETRLLMGTDMQPETQLTSTELHRDRDKLKIFTAHRAGLHQFKLTHSIEKLAGSGQPSRPLTIPEEEQQFAA